MESAAWDAARRRREPIGQTPVRINFRSSLGVETRRGSRGVGGAEAGAGGGGGAGGAELFSRVVSSRGDAVVVNRREASDLPNDCGGTCRKHRREGRIRYDVVAMRVDLKNQRKSESNEDFKGSMYLKATNTSDWPENLPMCSWQTSSLNLTSFFLSFGQITKIY